MCPARYFPWLPCSFQSLFLGPRRWTQWVELEDIGCGRRQLCFFSFFPFPWGAGLGVPIPLAVDIHSRIAENIKQEKKKKIGFILFLPAGLPWAEYQQMDLEL